MEGSSFQKRKRILGDLMNVHCVYRCDSWTIKKAECQRTDAFQLWYWKRLMSVPWTPGEGNGNLLQHSCLGNLMDRGTWWATVHGNANESDTS